MIAPAQEARSDFVYEIWPVGRFFGISGEPGETREVDMATVQDQLAAKLLGLGLSELRRLRYELKRLRGEGNARVELEAPLKIYRDPVADDVWEAEPTGIVTGTRTGLVVEFRFAVTVIPDGTTLGMSQTPDKYTVRTAGGAVLLDNMRVHCHTKRIEEEPLPWAAYSVFDPLRAVVMSSLTARRIVGLLPIEVIIAEPGE